MVETITATASPALEHIIERPRLIARLAEDGGSRITLLAAPAGYGKTTLARQWSEQQRGPVAWYRATRASGDVALLAVELDELLASIAPDLPREPRKVASIASVNPSPEPLGRAIVRTFGSLGEDVLLVVDEWEAAETDEAEELLSLLVDRLEVRFLLTARARPDWFTPRLKVYGEGLEIGKDELAMTEEEASDVLFYVRDKEASTEVRAVAEGWPAVLGLAAMHAKSGSSTGPLTVLPDALYQYLATELIDAATLEVRDAATLVALTSLSDLETARRLLGTSAERLLEAAREQGLATIDKSRRVAIHPLLRRVLVDRLVAESEAAERWRATFDRILEHRLWDEAQAVADVLPLPGFVAQALEDALPDLLRDGRLTTLRKWIEIGRRAEAPAGLLDYAESELSLRSGETLRAYGLALQAAQGLESDLAGRAHLVAGRAAHLRDQPKLTEAHADAAAALAKDAETREEVIWLRLLCAIDRETTDVAGRLEDFIRLASPESKQQLMAAAGRLGMAVIEGELGEAIEHAAVALAAAAVDVDPVAHTGLLSIYSYVLRMVARYERSLRATEALASVAENWGIAFALRYAKINKAAAHVGLRRFALAERLLSSLERETRDQPGSYFRSNLAVQRARLYASIGDLQRALDVLSLGPVDGSSRAERGEFLGWQALLHAAGGDCGRAGELFQEARTTSRGRETEALSLMAEAIVARKTGDSSTAFRLFDHAVATEAWDPIVIAVRADPDLARDAATSRKRRTWLMKLLSSSSDSSLAASLGLKIPRAAKPREELSPREQEVHELLAQGLTNEDIAKLLYISLSTTKVHVKHIFEKLGVRSRFEAARALRDDAV
jgi:ATP/maltotriose-dependent transcriptional regulator MalT